MEEIIRGKIFEENFSVRLSGQYPAAHIHRENDVGVKVALDLRGKNGLRKCKRVKVPVGLETEESAVDSRFSVCAGAKENLPARRSDRSLKRRWRICREPIILRTAGQKFAVSESISESIPVSEDK